MKKLYVLGIFLLLTRTGIAQYEEVIDVSDALQSTLDLRTSAVKIIKDYLYRGLKVNYVSKENDENLSNGEISLLRLEIYAQDHPELSDKVNKLKQQWKKLRNLAIHKPKREKMKVLLPSLKRFLNTTDQLIGAIKKTDSINIINYQHASNEMEVLAQQLAFLYGMKVAGIVDPTLNHEIEQCQKDFQKNLDETFFSGENTIDITRSLKAIQADWQMAKQTARQGTNERFLNTIYILMNKISDESRKAALLYQEKAKEELKKKK